MVDARRLQGRPRAVAPGDTDGPGARGLRGMDVVLRVADDHTLGRGDAEGPRSLEDRVRGRLLLRNGISTEDEGEERQEAGDPERLDGRVVTLVRHRGELPSAERRE